MARHCPRNFCPDCGQELIHRDNRRFYESSSALGQIIHAKPPRGAPRDFGAGDVDLFVHRCRNGVTLAKWIEHKQPGHKFEDSQQQSLRDFDRILRHAIESPPPGLSLHGDSGVYVVRGPLVVAERNWRRPVDFGGPQTLLNPDGSELLTFKTRQQFYDWLRGIITTTDLLAAIGGAV